jgi:quinol monooxygenase YgiN
MANTTEISVDPQVVVLINVFTVDPAKQQQLVDLLDKATEAVMRQQPGFISANIHRSLDGTRVTNYAQWRSQEHFQAMLKNDVARAHMKEAGDLALKFEPLLYAVASVHHA